MMICKMITFLIKKNNNSKIFKLQNPKIYRRKERPPGTKRFKLIHEASKVKTNQRQYKKCEIIGHYQKNCRVIYFFIQFLLSFILE